MWADVYTNAEKALLLFREGTEVSISLTFLGRVFLPISTQGVPLNPTNTPS